VTHLEEVADLANRQALSDQSFGSQAPQPASVVSDAVRGLAKPVYESPRPTSSHECPPRGAALPLGRQLSRLGSHLPFGLSRVLYVVGQLLQGGRVFLAGACHHASLSGPSLPGNSYLPNLLHWSTCEGAVWLFALDLETNDSHRAG
jgi:hypothetical protein